MYFKNQKFFVAGMSASGGASCDFLLRRGASVKMYDDVEDERVRKLMEQLANRGATVVTKGGVREAIDDSDVLVLVDSDFFETDGLVAEAVMLDMPSKLLCSEGCKGLCPVCGQNLNVKKCDCKKRQSPFDILKQEYNG